ncbi:hypothetical protein [Pseudogracilibacillus sp. ICA-222130]|uniref:hypothetical protein n=1 Tax=Pseudogracilibacillus sp. ICA-222130 TaxID=3134655 RepID=UPI0030C536B8
MKKIKDERLITLNLQNIKIAYIVQTIGIFGILGYEFFKNGMEGVTKNPLWFVFILTAIVYNYLNMSINVENEKEPKNATRSYIISFIVVMVFAITFGVLTAITPNFNWSDGLLIGGTIFISGIIPVSYIYRLRLKQEKDMEEDD